MVEKFGRCRAQVEIADRVTAVSSWVEVAAALDQLAILCRRMTVPEGWRVAGWLVMGPEERIKVSLLGPGDEVDDGGVGGGLNGTGRGVE